MMMNWFDEWKMTHEWKCSSIEVFVLCKGIVFDSNSACFQGESRLNEFRNWAFIFNKPSVHNNHTQLSENPNLNVHKLSK